MNMPFQTFDEQGDASNCAPRLAALGLEPVVNSPEAFGAHIKAEVARWSRVIRAAHIGASE